MRRQNRHICLFLDNFSAHYVDYEPRNIDVEFFEPGMTSYVQPCDAGIIRTTKALYRKEFCLRAIEEDEAGKRDIYKIDLLEAMLMAKRAWAQVNASTIEHCWDHTKIQPDDSARPANPDPKSNATPATSNTSPTKDLKAWEVVREFAMSDDMRLPQAEQHLYALLGDRYVEADWQPALKVVMDAENDVEKALKGLDRLTESIFGMKTSHLSTSNAEPTQQSCSIPTLPTIPQLTEAENGLKEAVDDLKQRKRIIGTPLTLEEMLNPIEEREVGNSEYRFEGGEDEIVDQVNHEMALKRGEIEEIE